MLEPLTINGKPVMFIVVGEPQIARDRLLATFERDGHTAIAAHSQAEVEGAKRGADGFEVIVVGLGDPADIPPV